MHNVTAPPAASNAAPSPVRTAPAVPDAFESAYDAAKAHPAYRDLREIRDQLVKLHDLCEKFGEEYHPDSVSAYLRRLGFRKNVPSDDFPALHNDVLGLVWILDVVRSHVDTALPIDSAHDEGRKDGAA